VIRFLIVQDYKENPRKCTALPIADLKGVELLRFRRPPRGDPPVEIPGGIWLDIDAPVLEERDRSHLRDEQIAGDEVINGLRVVVFDATWRRIGALAERVVVREGDTLVKRSLPHGLETAYPRRSKIAADPARGLATVEAMFAVTALLGAERMELLARYRWADRFLAANRELFAGAGSGVSVAPRD
jgi:pre-rRNA-processing protein TSR3